MLFEIWLIPGLFSLSAVHVLFVFNDVLIAQVIKPQTLS